MHKKIEKLIKYTKSYMAYKKLIRENFPLVHKQLKEGPYLRYAENLYLYIHQLTERPSCTECAKELKYIDRTVGYGIYCGTKCSANSNLTQVKRKITNSTKSHKERLISSNKRKNTMLSKYGFEHALQVPKFVKIVIDKNLKNASIRMKKAKETNLKRHGVEFYSQCDEFKKKIKATNNKRYGVDWSLQNQDIKKKGSKSRKQNFYDRLSQRCPNAIPLFDEFHYVSYNYKWQCKKCNTIFYDHIDDGSQPMCTTCYPAYSFASIPERKIIHYIINELHISNIIQGSFNIIPPKEIDIYLPDYKLAIEFNGEYWHSPGKLGGTTEWFKYHQDKIDLCAEHGIRLLHIWEYYGDHHALIVDAINGQINNDLRLVFEDLYS